MKKDKLRKSILKKVNRQINKGGNTIKFKFIYYRPYVNWDW